MKKLLWITLLFTASFLQSSGQDYTLDSTRIHAQANPGDLFLASLIVTNNTGNTLTFRLNRILKDLPANWTSCFCHPTCIAPWIDTLTFSIPPFGTDSIKPNFGTDSTPGTGHITVALSMLEGESFSPGDTIYFTGSTLNTSVDEEDVTHGIIYPNPAEDFLEVVFPHFKSPFVITVYDIQGREILKSRITSQRNTVNISSLVSGIYFLSDDAGAKKLTFVKQ